MLKELREEATLLAERRDLEDWEDGKGVTVAPVSKQSRPPVSPVA